MYLGPAHMRRDRGGILGAVRVHIDASRVLAEPQGSDGRQFWVSMYLYLPHEPGALQFQEMYLYCLEHFFWAVDIMVGNAPTPSDPKEGHLALANGLCRAP